MNIAQEISTLTKARYPILWVETFEERRITQIIGEVAREQGKKLLCWASTTGLRGVDNKPFGSENTEDPMNALETIWNISDGALVVLKDFHQYISDPLICRKLRDLHQGLKQSHVTMIITSPTTKIPLDLQKMITVLDLPLPNKEELGQILGSMISGLQTLAETDANAKLVMENVENRTANGGLDPITQAGLGLTLDEYENVIAKCFVQHDLSIGTIIGEKHQIIKKSGVLEYQESLEGMQSVGGLEVLKGWVRSAKKRFTKKAEEYGLEKPKGILLIGPPGTGKSLSAKVTAQELQLPLLRLDMSSIASKWYGETTVNIKHALKLAEAVSPCVFWWDEIEKMLSTGGAGQEGHEETMRALSVLLTHFEECDKPILRVATCNNPKALKPELMQRFEKIFHIDLPNKNEREEIFRIHISKVKRDPAKYDLGDLARLTNGYVGREIRTIVKEALSSAFNEDRELEHHDLTCEIDRIKPMSKQKKAEILEMRDWALVNCINASIPEIEEKKERRIEL